MTEECQLKIEYLQSRKDCIDMIAQVPEDKLMHFKYVLQSLMSCYVTEQARALVLVSETPADRDRISLMAINANDVETKELIDTLCVFRQMDFDDQTTTN